MKSLPGVKIQCWNGVAVGGQDASDAQTLWFVGVGMPACREGILKYPGMWESEKMLIEPSLVAAAGTCVSAFFVQARGRPSVPLSLPQSGPSALGFTTLLFTQMRSLCVLCIRLLFHPVFCIFCKEIDLIKNAIKFINWQKISFQSIRKRHKKDAFVSLTVSAEPLSRKYEICLHATKSLWT